MKVYAQVALSVHEIERGGAGFAEHVRRSAVHKLAEEILSNRSLHSSMIEYDPYLDRHVYRVWVDVIPTGQHREAPDEIKRAVERNQREGKMANYQQTMRAAERYPATKRDVGPEIDTAAEVYKKRLDEVRKNAVAKLDADRPSLPTKGSP